MRLSTRIKFLCILGLLLSACTHAPVWVKTDENITFSGPQAFAWKDDIGQSRHSPEASEWRQALQARLLEKGWQMVDLSEATFLADSSVFTEQREQARALPMGGIGRHRADVYWEPYLVQWHVFWLSAPDSGTSLWDARIAQRVDERISVGTDQTSITQTGALNQRREHMRALATQVLAELP